MKKMRHLILLIILCMSPLCLHAQESMSRQIYSQAEGEYETGRIEQAIQLLQGHLEDFDGLLKQSAYRLLSLCCYTISCFSIMIFGCRAGGEKNNENLIITVLAPLLYHSSLRNKRKICFRR